MSSRAERDKKIKGLKEPSSWFPSKTIPTSKAVFLIPYFYEEEVRW